MIIADKFKLVNVRIQLTPDVKMTVKKILEACFLSTEYVDKIKSPQKMSSAKPFSNAYSRGDHHANASTYYDETSSAFKSDQEIKAKIHRAKMEKTLKYSHRNHDFQFD